MAEELPLQAAHGPASVGPEAFSLESFAKGNGSKYWCARDLAEQLGYESYGAFVGVINKAMASCVQLGIQIPDAFLSEKIIRDDKEVQTYRLTRFACFLTAMHADGKKPQVAAAKLYLSAIAASIIEKAIDSNDLERLEVREELKSGENYLSGIAKVAGIDPKKYGLFKDAGYRGMYEMGIRDLKKYKGIDVEATIYDFMGKTELAGNWFRVTQTAERIKTQSVKGQSPLERAAHTVGREVRHMMIKNSGVAPEQLPLTENIREVKKRLTQTNKGMLKLDGGQKKKDS